MSHISKIVCKRCNKDLMKGSRPVDEGLAARLMTIHDKVVHTQDYQITIDGER